MAVNFEWNFECEERDYKQVRPWARPFMRRAWTRRPLLIIVFPLQLAFTSALVLWDSIKDVTAQFKELW
jgi:hypothetical protein